MTQAAILAASGSPGTTTGFKNRIINGNMAIDQRNAGSAVTANNAYTLDRWIAYTSAASKYTVQQVALGGALPSFPYAMKIVSSSAYTVGAGDYFFLGQLIEGFNVADLNWGTANAKTVTLSFQVYSSLTGTFGGTLQSASSTRSYPFTYSIPVANTWTTISVTIAGDTSGTWLTNNGVGLGVYFALGVGSTYSGTAGSWSGSNYFSATGAVSVVSTNAATWYVTGVQLEAGTTATNFDFRSIAQEIALCERYYFQQGGNNYTRFGGAIAIGRSATQATSPCFFPVCMRTFPTVTAVNVGNMSLGGSTVTSVTCSDFESTSTYPVGPARLNVFVGGGLSTGTGYEWESGNNTTTRLTFSAEL